MISNPSKRRRLDRRSNAELLLLLREVSRSFFLTLRVLPRQVRPQIGLAYLLARAADTIADTEILPVTERLEALQAFRRKLQGGDAGLFHPKELAGHQGTPGERRLLERIDEAFAWLEGLDRDDQQLIRDVLATITSGQELDLQRFAYASVNCIIPLKSDRELDDYTYRVAGCVGEFWTRVCRAHVFPSAPLEDARLMSDGVRFGKGLQLINILRDLPADLRRGRCYLPQANLSELNLEPIDLLIPANENRVRPVYDDYLGRAESHLTAGWNYANQLPWSAARVRLACAWPILIGLKTLTRLKRENILDPAQPIKIHRREVQSIMFRSLITYPFPGVWRRLFSSTRT